MPEICGIKYKRTSYCFRPDFSSELLMESLELRPGATLLDMGSGTGVIGIYAAKRGARVLAVDISSEAVDQTRLNSGKNSVELRVRKGDLFSDVKGRFDMVAFNAPFTRLTVRNLEDRRMHDRTGASRIGIVSRFLSRLSKHLNGSGVGYLVLSSRGPVTIFERIASRSHLKWSICREYDRSDETVYVVRLTPRSGAAGARRTPPLP
ncbi:MAG: methyltransferase [Thaumarchaeota archaeon]|nr:methyltransferase [Nitrososphaerota archaeon]